MHDTEVGLRNQNADEPRGNWVWFLPTNILLPPCPHFYTLDEEKPLSPQIAKSPSLEFRCVWHSFLRIYKLLMWLDPMWLSSFTLEELLSSERLSFFPEVTELLSSRGRLVKKINKLAVNVALCEYMLAYKCSKAGSKHKLGKPQPFPMQLIRMRTTICLRSSPQMKGTP